MTKIPEAMVFRSYQKAFVLGLSLYRKFLMVQLFFLFHSIVFLLLRCTQRIIGFQQLPSTEPVEGENCSSTMVHQ